MGFGLVLQQTPFVVTVTPPSEVTFPPVLATESVSTEIGEVVTIGSIKPAFNLTHVPPIYNDKVPKPFGAQSVQ